MDAVILGGGDQSHAPEVPQSDNDRITDDDDTDEAPGEKLADEPNIDKVSSEVFSAEVSSVHVSSIAGGAQAPVPAPVLPKEPRVTRHRRRRTRSTKGEKPDILTLRDSKLLSKIPKGVIEALNLVESGVVDPILLDNDDSGQDLQSEVAQAAADVAGVDVPADDDDDEIAKVEKVEKAKKPFRDPKKTLDFANLEDTEGDVWQVDVNDVSMGSQLSSVDVGMVSVEEAILPKTLEFTSSGLPVDGLHSEGAGQELQGPPDSVVLNCEQPEVGEPSPDPPAGSIMIPDDITSTVFRGEIIPRVASARPYLKISYFGIQTHLSLLDSGSQISCYPEDQYNLLKAEFAKKGHTIPQLDEMMSIKVFGGKVISHSAVALFSLRLPNGAEVYNIPFVIVPTTPEVKTTPLIGSNFLAQTRSKLKYFKTHCELHLGGKIDLPPLKATLVGKEQHPVTCMVSVDLLPKETKYVEFTFEFVPLLPTNLDDEPMMLTGELSCIDIDQVVVAKEGTIHAVVTNVSDHPYTILENTRVGNCELMSSIQESIELVSLDSYVNIVELSRLRISYCICSDTAAHTALIINLNKGNLSLLGTDHEWVSPHEGRISPRSKSANVSCRGRHIFLWADGAVKKVLTLSDVDKIKEYYPVGSTHLVMPYIAGKMIDLPTMESCQLLREAGYTLSIPAFLPQDAKPPHRCDKCLNSRPDQLMTPTEMYKVSELTILFPNPEGTIPADFAHKLMGTEKYIFKLWDWEISYYLVHPTKVVFHIHLPPPMSMRTDAVRVYLLTFLAYLKTLYVHATVRVAVCKGTKASPNEGLKTVHSVYRMWEEPFMRAWEQVKLHPSYLDYGLPKPRLKRSDDALPTETFNFTSRICSCLTCQGQDSDSVLMKVDEHYEILFSGLWRQEKDLPKVIGRAGSEASTDLVEVCQLVCGNVPDDSYTIREQPTCPDETDLAPPPIESKVPVGDLREHLNLDHLTADQARTAIDLLTKYKSCISVDKGDVSVIKNHAVSFSVTNEEPFFLPCFPMNPSMTKLLMDHFRNMEARGFVHKDLSASTRTIFYSNSFLVHKNTMSRLNNLPNYRVVSNFVEVNRRIRESDRGYALPNHELLFTKYHSYIFVTNYDAQNYFPSHRLTRATSRFLGLSTPHGFPNYYAGIAMLGVRVWPSVCTLTMNCTYDTEVKDRLNTWIDDFSLITSLLDNIVVPHEYQALVGTGEGLDQDWANHLALNDKFLEQSAAHGLLFAVDKIQFGVKSFRYLGFDFELQGKLKVPPIRFKVLDEFDMDNCTQRALQHVLGLLQYCSAVLDNYAARSFPLYKLATQKVPAKTFKLDDFHKMCLRDLIHELKNSVNRHCYNPGFPVEFVCDASLVSAAVIIWQTIGNRRHLLRVASWSFDNATIRNASSLTKEFYAIVLSLKAFPLYAGNAAHPLRVYTDCRPLYDVMSNAQKLNPDSKLHRWAICLLQLPNVHFVVNHMSSKDPYLSLTDFLSRDARLAPRVVSRLSNRLQTVPPEQRPTWNDGAIITVENLTQYILSTNLVAFPKTRTQNEFFQLSPEDPLLKEGYFDKLFHDFFLPSVAWPMIYRENPPAKAISVASQDSGPKESSEVGEELVNEDGTPAQIDSISSDQAFGESRQAAHRDLSCHLASILCSPAEQLNRIRNTISEKRGIPFTLDQLSRRQAEDPNLAKISKALAAGTGTAYWKNNYMLYEGSLLTKLQKSTGRYRICLDFETAVIIVAWHHLYNHTGIKSSYKNLSLWYNTPHLTAIIEAVQHSCSPCLFNRARNPDQIPGITKCSAVAFERLVMDHISFPEVDWNSGKASKVLCLVDTATRFVMGAVTEGVSAQETADVLRILVPNFPGVKYVESDGAKGISGKLVRDLLFDLGVNSVTHLPARSQAGSIAESALRVVRQMTKINLRYLKQSFDKDWPDVVPTVLRQMNTMQKKFFLFEPSSRPGEQNRIKTIYSSSCMLAFGYCPNMTLSQLLGSPQNLSLNYKEEWRDLLHEALRLSCETREEIQARLDEAWQSKMAVKPGDLCLLQTHGRYEKKEQKMSRNLYRCIARNNRFISLVNIYGPKQTVTKAYSGYVFPFVRESLLKFLSDELRLALGAPMIIEAGDEVPFELRTSASEKKKKKKTKVSLKKRVQGQAAKNSSPQTDSEAESEVSAVFLDLPAEGRQRKGSRSSSLSNSGPSSVSDFEYDDEEYSDSDVVDVSDSDESGDIIDVEEDSPGDTSPEPGLGSEAGARSFRLPTPKFPKWAKKNFRARKN